MNQSLQVKLVSLLIVLIVVLVIRPTGIFGEKIAEKA